MVSVKRSFNLNVLKEDRLGNCKRCRLCKTRQHIVFGSGNPSAEVMFVGEGPGATEDETGEPFVGAAGKLLNKYLKLLRLKRDDVYIANVVKCRPPKNRTPLPDEITACKPFLEKQIRIIKPLLIVTLGATAAKALVSVFKRGGMKLYVKKAIPTTPVIMTFHPAYILRDRSKAPLMRKDFKFARQQLKRERHRKAVRALFG